MILGGQCNSASGICTAEDSQTLCKILPSSIEKLWIQLCDEKILPHMRELATLKSDKFPHLNDLTLEIGEAEFQEIMGFFSDEEGEEEVLIMERISRDYDTQHYWLRDWNYPG